LKPSLVTLKYPIDLQLRYVATFQFQPPGEDHRTNGQGPLTSIYEKTKTGSRHNLALLIDRG
jgi:hypothetical protein